MIRPVSTFSLQIHAKRVNAGQRRPTGVSALRSADNGRSGRASREGGRRVAWGGARAAETASLSLGISLRSIKLTRPRRDGTVRSALGPLRRAAGAARGVSRSVDGCVELRETPRPRAPLQTQGMRRSGGHDYPPPTCSPEGAGSGSRVHFACSCRVGRRRARIGCLDLVSYGVLS
jgi:hypothetical protein